MKKENYFLILPVAVVAIIVIAVIMRRKRKAKKMYKEFIQQQERAGEKLTPAQKRSIMAIINSFVNYGDGDNRKLSYILATAKHESKFRPVRECFAINDSTARSCVSSNGRKYATEINGHVYYGRGFVQLTWHNNYRKMGNRLGIDLVNNPDKALETNVAAQILVVGMLEGLFTGKKLSQYINGNFADYVNARKTVNALDRAELIAGYAGSFENGLPA